MSVEIHASDESPNTTVDSVSSTSSNGAESATGQPAPVKVKLGREIELLMDALSSLNNPEERIATLCKKYSDLLDDQRRTLKQLKSSQKTIHQLKHEKEEAATLQKKAEKEADSHKTACVKLQSLCRELQNQNRKVKTEQLRIAKEEEDRRKQLIEKFQGSLENITKQLDSNSESNLELRKDNIKLTEQLGDVAEKYKDREQQYFKTLEMVQEQEKLMRQKILALEEARKYDGEKLNETLKDLMAKTQSVVKLSVEKEQLHKQVAYYSERFEDFNDTLSKSNEAISGFSNEMAKLQKINNRLEKTAYDWKQKHHNCQQQLICLTESNLKVNQKNDKLESLCRALQERNKKAKDENVEVKDCCSKDCSKGDCSKPDPSVANPDAKK